MAKEYLILVDPGKKRDPTAIMVMRDNIKILDGSKRAGVPDKIQHFYEIIHLDKVIDTRFTEVCRIINVITEHRDIKNNHDLVIDGTGIGEVVIDILRENYLIPVPIVFTGPGQVREVFSSFGKVFGNGFTGAQVLKEIHVPKEDLVAAGQNIVQQGRLAIAPGLKFEDDFKRQMLMFRGKVNEKTRNVSYNANTEEDHDDLVVCFLMGAWWFTRSRKTDEQVIPPEKQKPDWNPMDYL